MCVCVFVNQRVWRPTVHVGKKKRVFRPIGLCVSVGPCPICGFKFAIFFEHKHNNTHTCKQIRTHTHIYRQAKTPKLTHTHTNSLDTHTQIDIHTHTTHRPTHAHKIWVLFYYLLRIKIVNRPILTKQKAFYNNITLSIVGYLSMPREKI
mgnify:CR=1 FL=1